MSTRPTAAQVAAALVAYDSVVGLAPYPPLMTRYDAILAALTAAAAVPPDGAEHDCLQRTA